MGMMDHWQPVALARTLKRRPVGVTVCGRPIALFRPRSGGVAALADVCPHRRLKLSVGAVVGERLRCQYHGWTFDACGGGESPGTPKLHATVESYDAREAHGLVWVKSRDSRPEFPAINPPAGFVHTGTLQYDAPAPLELVLDNFNEVEHSGTVHDTFGYDLDRMNEVTVKVESTDRSYRVTTSGPTKRIFWWYAFWLGVRRGDLFQDDWTTYFSPVYSVFDHWWSDPTGARERMTRWRVYLFYVPETADTTRVFAVSFAKSRYPLPGGGVPLIRWLIRKETDRELRQDTGILRHVADKSVGIEGMKLSRFDKVLGLTRERISHIYRGEPAGRVPLA